MNVRTLPFAGLLDVGPVLPLGAIVSEVAVRQWV